MATKKTKSVKKTTRSAARALKSKAAPATKKAAKKAAKKTLKTAKTLLGKLAQRSAQLILDSGVLGEAPKGKGNRKPAKKRG